MDNLDLPQFTVQVMNRICAVYHRQPNSQLVETYFQILRPFSLADILGAVYVWLNNQDRWPAPVNLLEGVRTITNRHPKIIPIEPELTEEELQRNHVSLILLKWNWLPQNQEASNKLFKSMRYDQDQHENWWMKRVDYLLEHPEELAQMEADIEGCKESLLKCLTRTGFRDKGQKARVANQSGA